MPKQNNKKRIKVIKVPLSKRPKDVEQAFPRMPRLYLELIENKAKIKQDLINKEYVPALNEKPVLEFIDDYNNENHKVIEESKDKIEFEKFKDTSDDIFPPKKDTLDLDLDSLSDSDNSDSDVSVKRSESPVSSADSAESVNEDMGIDSDEDDLPNRLKELLNEDSDDAKPVKRHERPSKQDKYSRQRDPRGHSVQNHREPPTLAEIEAQGGYVRKRELRDVNYTSYSEQESEDAKRELLFKFDILKKKYPNAQIPDFSIHSDYTFMQKSYDGVVKRLSLDSAVEGYKKYLIGGFMAAEFVLGNYLGFDMQGFTQQQILSMNSYEKLLIELGEKSYVPAGSKWPVEIRLLGLILINALFFIGSKMMMKKTGANLMGMINNMNTSSQAVPQTKKRKMRGPNIDINDIPDAVDAES